VDGGLEAVGNEGFSASGSPLWKEGILEAKTGLSEIPPTRPEEFVKGDRAGSDDQHKSGQVMHPSTSDRTGGRQEVALEAVADGDLAGETNKKEGEPKV